MGIKTARTILKVFEIIIRNISSTYLTYVVKTEASCLGIVARDTMEKLCDFG